MAEVVEKAREKKEAINVLASKGGMFVKKPRLCNISTRRVVTGNMKLDTKYENIIKDLYSSLVPGDATSIIDAEMIIKEAMPAFEKTVGTATFTRFKKYIGFGVKNPQKNALRPAEYQSIVGRLRTVENAQHYISGYKELVRNSALKLIGAPEGMSDIVKTKVIRMFLVLFCGYYYFIEDFQDVVVDGRKMYRVNITLADQNNKKILGPEELDSLMKAKFTEGENDRIYYDTIVYEFEKLAKAERKEVLEFSELEYSDGTFKSVNNGKIWTFGQVRQIKQRMFKVPCVAPMEMFACEDIFRQISFSDVYTIYKILKTTPVETFPLKMRSMAYLEGSRFVNRNFPCYEFIENYEITGDDEADRYIHLFDFIVEKHIKLVTGFMDEQTKEVFTERVDSAVYFGAIKFAYEMGYLSDYTLPEEDLKIAADIVVNDEGKDNIHKYLLGEITASNLKDLLEIDDEFEKMAKNINANAKRQFTRKFNKIKKAEENMVSETAENIEEITASKPKNDTKSNCNVNHDDDKVIEMMIAFAVESGFGSNDAEGIKELITKVVIPSNKSAVESFVGGNISSCDLERKLGLDDEFGEMFFDLSKVDIAKIEAKLMQLKRKLANENEIKANKLLIYLYTYLVENSIACGKKHKAPKRNKSLKTQNLLALVD